MVHAPDLSAPAIRAAMERGDFYASTGVSFDVIDASKEQLSVTIHEARVGTVRYTTRFVGQGGKVLAVMGGVKPTYKFAGTEGYVRAATMDSNGRQAWTQPVFLDGRQPR
jgi:hypothetical protein